MKVGHATLFIWMFVATTSAAGQDKDAISSESEQKAIAAIRKLGGRVRFDTSAPGRSLPGRKGDPVKPVISVNFYGTRVTDAGLVHLKGLTKLETLNLQSTDISDTGLIHLKGLASLKTLDLRSTKVSDALSESRSITHSSGLSS